MSTATATRLPVVASPAIDSCFIDPAALPPLRPVLVAAPLDAPAAPPSDDEPRVPDLAPGTWRCAEHVKKMVRGGAVLRYLPGGCFVLEGRDGAELARASRTSDLAALLDGIAGKVPRKGRVILSVGKLMPTIARVRFTGESLGALVKTAVEREVARRTAEFDAECAALDGAGVCS